MTWAYDDPFAAQQARPQAAPIQTLYGGAPGWGLGSYIPDHELGQLGGPPSATSAWCYDGVCHADQPDQLGAAPDLARIAWDNRPVETGLYWMAVSLPKPMTLAKLGEIYNEKKPPWDSSMFPLACGAFTKIQNGVQVLIYGPEIEDGYRNESMVFGDQEGQYQFNNAMYAFGNAVTKYVDTLYFYGIMLEDADSGNLDVSGGITAYYDSAGKLLYEEDIYGNRSMGSQSLEGFPAYFVYAFVVFLMSYFGFLGSAAQQIAARIGTTLLARGKKALGKMADKLTEALKSGASSAAKAAGGALIASWPWIVAASVGVAVLWNLASDSGGRRR